MIKFFRKIRYDLLEKNLPAREGTAKPVSGGQSLWRRDTGKTGKPASQRWRYLKYAIGEIILVVVGPDIHPSG